MATCIAQYRTLVISFLFVHFIFYVLMLTIGWKRTIKGELLLLSFLSRFALQHNDFPIRKEEGGVVAGQLGRVNIVR